MTDRARPAGWIDAFCALSTAASRYTDARYAAAGQPPGSPAQLRRAELLTDLADRRVAHTIARAGHDGRHYTTDEIQRDGLLTLECAVRLRRERVRRE